VPALEHRCRQPADRPEDVKRRDSVLVIQQRLGRADDPALELRLHSCAGLRLIHNPRR